jgi:hypothetical protein
MFVSRRVKDYSNAVLDTDLAQAALVPYIGNTEHQPGFVGNSSQFAMMRQFLLEMKDAGFILIQANQAGWSELKDLAA